MEPETIHNRMAAGAGRLTFREVADLTGVHPETVRRYMTKDMPSPEFIAAFCRGLAISADWLMLGTPPMNADEALRLALRNVPASDLFAAIAASFDGFDPPPDDAGDDGGKHGGPHNPGSIFRSAPPFQGDDPDPR